MSKVDELLDELLRNVAVDPWEPTDTGFQMTAAQHVVKLRTLGSTYQMVLESLEGHELFTAEGVETGYSDVQGKLATLVTRLSARKLENVTVLDDVLKDLRTTRQRRASR